MQEHPELRWERMSVSVPQSELHQLPAILRNISQAEIARMQQQLSCAWRRIWFSSIYGSCLGEATSTDAFDALMTVFRQRAKRAVTGNDTQAACGVGGAGGEAHE